MQDQPLCYRARWGTDLATTRLTPASHIHTHRCRQGTSFFSDAAHTSSSARTTLPQEILTVSSGPHWTTLYVWPQSPDLGPLGHMGSGQEALVELSPVPKMSWQLSRPLSQLSTNSDGSLCPKLPNWVEFQDDLSFPNEVPGPFWGESMLLLLLVLSSHWTRPCRRKPNTPHPV